MSHMKYGYARTSARRPDDSPTTCRTETRPVPEDKGLSGATAYCIRSGATGKLATKRRWLLSDSIGRNALLTRTAGVTRSGSRLKARHGPQAGRAPESKGTNSDKSLPIESIN